MARGFPAPKFPVRITVSSTVTGRTLGTLKLSWREFEQATVYPLTARAIMTLLAPEPAERPDDK